MQQQLPSRLDAAQPDQFFPWLASWVSGGGPFACNEARFGGDGTIRFALGSTLPDAEVSLDVVWSAARAELARVVIRAGSSRVLEDPSALRRWKRVAAEQIRRRLALLERRLSLPLLERRNREMTELFLRADLYESISAEQLAVGSTCCAGFKLSAIEAERRTVRSKFHDGHSRVTVCVSSAADAARAGAVFRHGPLQIWAEPTASPGSRAERVCDYVAYVLSLAVHDGMRVAVEDPSGAGPPGESGVGPNANPSLFEHVSDSGAAGAALFASRGKVVPIFHADRECSGHAPLLTGMTETPYLPVVGVRPTLERLRLTRIVDTSELDAIMTGGQRILTDLFEQAAHDAPELVFVMGTCVSRVIGDDVQAALAAADPEARRIPTIWVETTATNRDQHHRVLWRRLVEIFQKPATPGAPDAVNLIGYAYWRSRALGELTELLASISVRRNAAIVPSFDVDEMRRFGDAKLNLVLPSVTVRQAVSWAREAFHAPTVELPAPYGIAATRAWVDAVGEKLGRGPLTDEWLARRMDPLQARWDRLRAAAAEHRVGIVLTADHFFRELPLSRGGVPWVALLQEMGFGLDLFLLPAGTGAEAERAETIARARIRALLDDPARHTVTTLASVAELGAALEQAPCELVYTETLVDRRATAHGKVPVSYVDFEMGFEGACRSLERLVRAARTPFFRRYGRYLPVEGW